jgi:hypothetical protein
MVDTNSLALHGFLFLSYIAAVTYWAIWNRASNAALDSTVNIHFITNLKTEYLNWMKSYY